MSIARKVIARAKLADDSFPLTCGWGLKARNIKQKDAIFPALLLKHQQKKLEL